MSNPSPTDIAWAAGLFEGEGCLHRHKRGYGALFLAMTDEDIVRRFAAIFGLKVYGPYKTGHKPSYVARTEKFELVQHAFATMYRYLGPRRREAGRKMLRG